MTAATHEDAEVVTQETDVERRLRKLRAEWEAMTAHLPLPYVRSEYGQLCLDCGAMWEPKGPPRCPACTSEASMPLRMLDLTPNLAALGEPTRAESLTTNHTTTSRDGNGARGETQCQE